MPGPRAKPVFRGTQTRTGTPRTTPANAPPRPTWHCCRARRTGPRRSWPKRPGVLNRLVVRPLWPPLSPHLARVRPAGCSRGRWRRHNLTELVWSGSAPQRRIHRLSPRPTERSRVSSIQPPMRCPLVPVAGILLPSIDPATLAPRRAASGSLVRNPLARRLAPLSERQTPQTPGRSRRSGSGRRSGRGAATPPP